MAENKMPPDLQAFVNNLVRRPVVRGGKPGPQGLGFRRVKMQPCGTYAAYLRHRKLDEPACRPCKDAARDYQRARAAAKRSAAAEVSRPDTPAPNQTDHERRAHG